MKNKYLQHLGADGALGALAARCKVAALAGLLLAATLPMAAMPTVDTMTGGPWQGNPLYYGYVDGGTAGEAQFHTPYALVLDDSGESMFVADRDNNAIRFIDADAGQTYTMITQWLNKPVGIARDSSGNIYVLNRGNGNNGNVLTFDMYGDFVATNAVALTNANGMARDINGNLYLTVQNNTVIRVTPAGVKSVVATVPHAGAVLRGLTVKYNGLLAVCDSGRHGIYLINPNTGVITTNAGFHGAGDFSLPNNTASAASAKFNQPYGVIEAGDGNLVVSDFGNHRVKYVLASGVVTNLYGVSSNYWLGPLNVSQGIFPGWYDGTVAIPDAQGGVEARQPVGLALASDGTLYVTEIYYHLIRKVTSTGLPPPPPPPPGAPTIISVTTNSGSVALTWSAVPNSTNYFVKRSTTSGGPYTIIAAVNLTSYNDTAVINGSTYYYVVSASNTGGEGANSAEVVATPPLPPVPDPQIGYVDFPPFDYLSVFHPISSVVLNNDAHIVIVGAFGSQTFYTFGNTSTNGIPNPTTASASAPSGYVDGLSEGTVNANYAVAQIMPDLTIKAFGHKSDGSPNSATVQARFQFVTANPVITGDNAALFRISDITRGAQLYYTLDGTDPSATNAGAFELAPLPDPTNSWTVSLSLTTNTLFKVRAFRNNYQPSAVVTATFSVTNFQANKLTFGFAAGEASSDFIASPGQYFYAPVTLSSLPGTLIYSLQFNMTVTNAGANPGPVVRPGAMSFNSFLEKPIPGTSPPIYERIPPLSFSAYAQNPPPLSSIVYYDGLPFVDMSFINTNVNLLGVGWLERLTQTNLYDTTKQDLVKYSQPHDTLFDGNNGKVVVGGYAFEVPTTALVGNTYRIQLGEASATADGIGGPSGAVFISTPTNGSLASGTINAVKEVTVGQRKYLAGDSAPFRWFNAGDFGNTNLDNSDVMQVFQSAIYGLNNPPYDPKSWNGTGYTNVSDFFDAMDSCGYTYAIAPGGYLVPDTNITDVAVLNGLFDGNDSMINYIGFGDGKLDVCDIYVTFRRSLDPSLARFRRFWTNGVRGAEMMSGVAPAPLAAPALSRTAFVSFSSADASASAGQMVQIPVKGSIAGTDPVRSLALSLSVEPLEGAPALTAPVQFSANPALGAPALTSSRTKGEYAATWLNNNTSGLTGDATLGTLTIQIPAGASSSAAYAVRFQHASASPNGLASFPKRTKTGLVTLADRSGSSWNDGISDAWRLRYFGSINNLLSAATADADGDGVDNKHEYLAGTDPNDAASMLKLKTGKGQNQQVVVRWPSVAGKQYVVERATSLYSPVWTAISTNSGTGLDMQYQDSATGSNPRFYRVRAQ